MPWTRSQAAEASRRYRERNPERAREIQERYKTKNADLIRERARLRARVRKTADPVGESQRKRAKRLRYEYGLTPEQWADLFAKQNRRCACCGATEPGRRNWQTDHDHRTGVVRGIICHRCNVVAGQCGDTAETVEALMLQMLRYLRGETWQG